MADLKPCPLCGSREVKLLWRASGVGGQMMTITGFAECADCMTVFRDVASSTAGFDLRECKRLWDELPERIEWIKRGRAERAAAKERRPKQAEE